LDVKAKINDDWSFYGQIIGNGGSAQQANFNLFAQFAYVNYTGIDGISIKGGRQSLPILMAGDVFRVGYDLPYRSKPTFIYNIPALSAFDGASVTKKFDTGVGEFSVEVFGGNPVNDFQYAAGQTYTVTDLLGAKVTLEGDGWRLRAQASRYYNTLTEAGVTVTGHTEDYSVGYKFDKWNIVSWGEYAVFFTPDGSQTQAGVGPGVVNGQYYHQYHGGYVLLGYRLGQFMPRYTFARAVSGDSTYPGAVLSHTVGVNWDAGKNIVVKAEYEYDLIPSPGNGFLTVQPTNSTSISGSALYAGVDFLF
jgi:hypothetical protein